MLIILLLLAANIALCLYILDLNNYNKTLLYELEKFRDISMKLHKIKMELYQEALDKLNKN